LHNECGKKPNILTYENAFSTYENVKSRLIVNGAMSGSPELSIVIPTYKRLRLLKEAIKSALAQNTSVSFEIIVVDNCQESETGQLVEEMIRAFGSNKLSLYRNDENIGMFGNWNRCIQLARAEWLTILNDDDRLEPRWVQSVWETRSGRSLIGVQVQMIGDVPQSSKFVRMVKRISTFFSALSKVRNLGACDFFYGHPFFGSLGVLFEKRALLELGGYSEKYWPASDYVLSYRYWLTYDARIINRRLAEYRWEDNASKRTDALAGFVSIGYLLRTAMICRAKAPIFFNIAKIISFKKASVDAYWHQLRFKVDLSAEQNMDEFLIEGRVRSKYTLIFSKVFIIIASWILCFIL
jgi:glycosyltransferase involved in cell wall biosynthesis